MAHSMKEVIFPVILFILFSLGYDFYGRRKKSSSRPLLASILDSICFFPFAFKLGNWSKPNDINFALKEAMRSTGLNDFGSDDISDVASRYDIARRLGLERSKAQYTPAGYFLTQRTLVKRMVVRLKLFNYVKKHPSVNKIEIKKPIFIIGFPRTGTTFLHELLGLHPGVQMHYTWEQIDPIPTTDNESFQALMKERKKRHDGNKFVNNLLISLMGDSIQRVHRIGYDEPEECTTPLSMDLPYAFTELPFIPFTAKESVAIGCGNAFKNYYKYLQVLTFQQTDVTNPAPAKTWMLKCPFHLPYLTELNNSFPDAIVVWTHRNPVECIASACSLYETLLRTIAEEDSIDRYALGLAVLEYTTICLTKAIESIAKIDKKSPNQVIHVKYKQTIRSPKELCRAVVAKADMAYGAEYDARLDQYLRASDDKRRQLKGKTSDAVHEYRLEDYGLSAALIAARFAEYIATYCE